MEKDPANRFQTADELRQVLNSYLSGRAVNISEPTRIIGAPASLAPPRLASFPIRRAPWCVPSRA